MTRTLASVLDEAQTVLAAAGLSSLGWTWVEALAVSRTRGGMVVGELGWRDRRVPFVCVERSLNYRLDQRGMSWQPGLSGRFALRLVIHRRHGFQAQIHDVDIESLGVRTDSSKRRVPIGGQTRRRSERPRPGPAVSPQIVSSAEDGR